VTVADAEYLMAWWAKAFQRDPEEVIAFYEPLRG
jgi:hypothetical protein